MKRSDIVLLGLIVGVFIVLVLDWVLLIEFENERVSALRVRTDDSFKYHPAEAPQDKERLRACVAQPRRPETVPELCPPGTRGAQLRRTAHTAVPTGV